MAKLRRFSGESAAIARLHDEGQASLAPRQLDDYELERAMVGTTCVVGHVGSLSDTDGGGHRQARLQIAGKCGPREGLTLLWCATPVGMMSLQDDGDGNGIRSRCIPHLC